MTAEALTAPVELSAAVSSGPAAACERRGVVSEQGVARACEIGDLGLVHELVASGANVNGFQPGEKRSVSVPRGTKRPLVGLDSLGDSNRYERIM